MSYTYHNSRRLVNLLGAFSLVADDAQREAVAAVAGRGGGVPAALVTIGTFPGQTIDELRRALGITHAGAVRLVDRLVADGRVERWRGREGRAVSLFLTYEGQRLEQELLNERKASLADMLEPLDEDERERLEALLEKMLTGRARVRPEPRYLCRLCERRVCAPCPVSRGAFGEDDPLEQ